MIPKNPLLHSVNNAMVELKSHLSRNILYWQIKFLLKFQQEFHYTLPDGTKIIKDERDPELEKGIVNLGTETPSTTLSSNENSEDSSIIP